MLFEDTKKKKFAGEQLWVIHVQVIFRDKAFIDFENQSFLSKTLLNDDISAIVHILQWQ